MPIPIGQPSGTPSLSRPHWWKFQLPHYETVSYGRNTLGPLVLPRSSALHLMHSRSSPEFLKVQEQSMKSCSSSLSSLLPRKHQRTFQSCQTQLLFPTLVKRTPQVALPLNGHPQNPSCPSPSLAWPAASQEMPPTSKVSGRCVATGEAPGRSSPKTE